MFQSAKVASLCENGNTQILCLQACRFRQLRAYPIFNTAGISGVYLLSKSSQGDVVQGLQAEEIKVSWHGDKLPNLALVSRRYPSQPWGLCADFLLPIFLPSIFLCWDLLSSLSFWVQPFSLISFLLSCFSQFCLTRQCPRPSSLQQRQL